eukprot:TRINITY_DN13462_c0_g1_i1.p1 TRINITY_DN13462_c0_g1~~TRINITY_DN13462_c0_g1_i1.p1  ORF type:complete len:1061 (-),score=213.43 TRINITY_DN13462_c0_g1_i1:344-3526(-)
MAMEVVGGLAAGGWAWGTAAYQYNMGRFQFDANQSQQRAHQHQNMLLAQWGLFREDIRDLFDMTTSKQSTYLVVGTLFLGFAINFIFNALTDFPFHPPWAMFFWTLSIFNSTAYGVLGVWLGMHASNAAHLAEIKVLTEAVRPHIPTAEELENVASTLRKYERSGPLAFLQVPAFLKFSGKSPPKTPSDNGDEEKPLAKTSLAASLEQARLLEVIANAKDPNNLLSDSALNCDHITLFRQIQMTYACFEGYARVAMLMGTHHLFMVAGYFIMTHYIVKHEHNRTCGAMCMLAFTYLSHLLFRLDLFVDNVRLNIVKTLHFAGPIFTTMANYMWVTNSEHILENRLFMFSENIPKVFAMLGALGMAIAEVWILFESRPNNSIAQLPNNYRPIRYIDVYGWWKPSGEEAKEMQDSVTDAVAIVAEAVGAVPVEAGKLHESSAHHVVMAASLREARRLQRSIDRILLPNLAENLSGDEVMGMEDLKDVLLVALSTDVQQLQKGGEGRQATISVKQRASITGRQLSAKRETSTSSSAGARNSSLRTSWIKLEMTTDTGKNLPYYLNTKNQEVVLQEPAGMVLDLPTIRSAVEFMEKRLNLDKLPSLPQDDACIFSSASSVLSPSSARFSKGSETDFTQETIVAAPLGWEDQADEQLRAPIETVAKRPGSRFDPRTIPWRYFRKTALTVACVWTVTAGWIFFRHIMYSKWQLPSAKQVETDWPHKLFKPSAVSCTNDTLVVADRFAVYSTGLPSAESGVTAATDFKPLLTAADRPTQWRSVTSQDCAAGTCSTLYFLAKDGLSVLEYHPARKSSKLWPLGPDLDVNLHAIAHMSKEAAALHCGNTWGLFAATHDGEVLVTCAIGDYVTPMFTLAGSPESLNTVKATSADVDTSGPDEYLALQVDNQGALWLLARIADGSQTELRVWTADGVRRGAWKMPPTSWWAPGFCMRSKGVDERTFVMGSLAQSAGPTARPQLWHFTLDLATVDMALGDDEDGFFGGMSAWLMVRLVVFVVVVLVCVKAMGRCWKRSRRTTGGADASVFTEGHSKLFSNDRPASSTSWGRQ